MTTQERFAEDWGMPLQEVGKLRNLALRAGKANEHELNGDREDGSTEPDSFKKPDNARYWHGVGLAVDEKILALVEPYGFTAVEYTGLGPTLKRGEQFVEVPY